MDTVHSSSSPAARGLIAGPRGRRMLIEYALACEHARDDDSFGAALMRSTLRDDLGRRSSRRSFIGDPVRSGRRSTPPFNVSDVAKRLDAVDLLAPTPELARLALANAAGNARPWQEPDAIDAIAAQPAMQPSLKRVAVALGAASDALGWHATAGDHTQALVYRREPSVLPSDSSLHESERKAVDDGWSSRPPLGTPSTTGLLFDGSPAALWFNEDDPGSDHATSVTVASPRADRVFEVGNSDDWAALCRRFPDEVTSIRSRAWTAATGREGPWVLPDWQRVAEYYDLVHLQIGAYITSAGVAIPVAGDVSTASMIAGWNPDESFWLTPALSPIGTPSQWLREQDQGPAWILAYEHST